jgi:hypothetical protein
MPCPRRSAPQGLAGRELPLTGAGWVDPIPKPEKWIGRPVRFARLDRLAQLSLVAAHQAAAGAADLLERRERAGVALGTAFGSHLANEAFQMLLEQAGPSGASPALFAYTLPSAAVGEISIHLGLKGPTLTLAHGIGSGLAVLEGASRLITRGEADWMLAGAADVLSPTLLRSVASHSVVLAEGAAFFALASERSGALARFAGSAQGIERDPARLLAEALEVASLSAADIKQHLVFDIQGGQGLGPVLGYGFAATPLLALCLAVHKGQTLPVAVTTRDPEGGVHVVCVTQP